MYCTLEKQGNVPKTEKKIPIFKNVMDIYRQKKINDELKPYLPGFLIIYDSKLDIFGFLGGQSDTTRRLKMPSCALGTRNGQLQLLSDIMIQTFSQLTAKMNSY